MMATWWPKHVVHFNAYMVNKYTFLCWRTNLYFIPLGKPRHRWECNIKMDLRDTRLIDLQLGGGRYVKTQLYIYPIYYVDDMFRPLWAIFRSQKCIMKTIQCMIISNVACSKLSTRFRWKFTICTTTNDHTLNCFPHYIILWPEDGPQWPKHVVVSIINRIQIQLCFDVPTPS